MAARIPRPFIQEVLDRTDLVDLIDARIPLKRSGSHFVARCPFHNEKTPSFSVNRDKQFYYCFGCGAHGSAIGFLMEYDRLDFREAVETLAGAAGLEVPYHKQESADSESVRSLDALYARLEQACRLYQQQLKSPAGERAVDYLRQRGLTGEIALQYRVGYAPPGNRNLPAEWPRDESKAAGLVGFNDSGRTYEWFRDRIVFPIRDRRGRIVGFGGRSLGEGMPKYLNSPETELFRKHREVYGLHELLARVRKPDYILVVEGYLDVITLAQFGIPQTVATLGTATSADHVALLFRYTREIIFCFDGDAAGEAAAWKALEASLTHLREGRQLRFLKLPESHDPDSLVREEGKERFLQRLQEARPFSDYFFEHLLESVDHGSLEGRATLAHKAQPLIDKLPVGIFRELIEQRLRELSGVELSHTTEVNARVERSMSAARGQATQPSALRTFLALWLQNPKLTRHIDERVAKTLQSDRKAGSLIRALFEVLRHSPEISSGALMEQFRDRTEEAVISRLIGWNTHVAEEKIEEEFLNYLGYLTHHRTRDERVADLIDKARQASLTPEEREELRTLTHRGSLNRS